MNDIDGIAYSALGIRDKNSELLSPRVSMPMKILCYSTSKTVCAQATYYTGKSNSTRQQNNLGVGRQKGRFETKEDSLSF